MTVLHAALNAMIARSAAEGVDYKGFNGADENTARALVSRSAWESADFLKARRLCWKYRRQLAKLGFYYNRESRLWAQETTADLTVKAAAATRHVVRDETPTEVKAAIIVRARFATKVWLPANKGTIWVPNSRMAFRSEGFKPGTRSGREFEVGMLTLPAYQIAQAAA